MTRMLMRTLVHFLFHALFILASLPLAASEDQWLIRPETPPRIKGVRKTGRSGATVDNLLEVPAMPVRQSERKRPPAPDTLMGKVIWGAEATFTASSGRKLPVADWNVVNVDAERFVEQARVLGQTYDWGNVNLSEFSHDPLKTPCLLFSGVRTLRLHEAQRKRLRQYVLRGGMIVCDSVYGSPYFYRSAKQMFAQAFPEKRFRVIPLDHPLYHIFHTIDHAHRPERPDDNDPFLEGIYVGSRIGVLVSRDGLGTGWHGDQKIMRELKQRGLAPHYYDIASARRLGVNIAAYIVGITEAAIAEAAPELPGRPGLRARGAEFVFAQLKHDGAWDVHPGAASALLDVLDRETHMQVNLQRVSLDPAQDDLTPYPVLYLTGLDDFTLSDPAIAALRTFFDRGGRLLVNNGLGLTTFHQAFQREIARVLPEADFVVLPPDHDLFLRPVKVIPADFNNALLRIRPDLGVTPYITTLEVAGELAVIYSPYDLEAGWLNTFYPLLKGYANRSAMDLGVNIITYLMTH